MKIGDFLVCKADASSLGFTKDKTYKIKRTETEYYTSSNTGSTIVTYIVYYFKNDYSKNWPINEFSIYSIFYTIKETRCIKLRKIKEKYEC